MQASYVLPKDGDLVIFDLTISEGHQNSAEVTDHPVEKGVNVVDHVRPLPFVLSLEVFVTNTPLDSFEGVSDYALKTLGTSAPEADSYRGSLEATELVIPVYEPPVEPTPGSLFRLALAGLSEIGSAILGTKKPPTAQLLTFRTEFDRIKSVQAQLVALQDTATLCTVATSTRSYENMLLTDISLPRTEAGGASFSLIFKQIRTVETATVEAPAPVEKRGEPSKAKGSQSTKPVPEKDASLLLKSALAIKEALGV